MEQDIRFCELHGQRIAYATVGEGPPLCSARSGSPDLEEEWDDPLARSFYEELAQNHRVVRYDRLGAGLSDRHLAGPLWTRETSVLEAVLEPPPSRPRRCSRARVQRS